MRKPWLLGLVLSVLTGCGDDAPPREARGPILRVSVSAAGEITADGKPVTLDRLAVDLTELKRRNGVVYYHREHPESPDPHPVAMKVIELIVRERLPVRLSTKADFSDAVTGGAPSGRGR